MKKILLLLMMVASVASARSDTVLKDLITAGTWNFDNCKSGKALHTVNDDPVYEDSNGKATLDSTSGPCIEAGEGEHSDAEIEAIRKAASELLGVNCVWVEEEEGTDEILGQPGKPPPI